MKTRYRAAAAALFASQAAVWGQLTINLLPGEVPQTGVLDIGSAAPGDIVDTRLRIRNTGASAATLSVLRIRGAGFTLEGNPSLPQLMAPGVNVDFRARFRPTGPGQYSATLEVNELRLLVRGAAAAGIALLRAGVPVTNEQPLEFGTITVGRRASIALLLRNESAQDLPVRQLSVSGACFSLAPSPPPSFLRAGDEAAFELRCDPERAAVLSGSLQLDERKFSLVALAREPEAPEALIELDPTAARSGRQSSLRVRLATPAMLPVAGTLALLFTPSVDARPGDEAIQFLANSSRSVSVQVAAGATEATVSGKAVITFQTGTTAGTAVFRLKLGSQEREVAVTLPPEAPMIDVVRLQPGQGGVDVTVTGFDNHRSAGNVVFTFTDQAGQEYPAISAEAAAAFKQHFADSALGGLFRLSARFPVTGDASKLARVSVRLANAIGAGTGKSE